VTSQTIGVDEVKMSIYKDQDNPVGRIGLYIQGETPGCSSLVTGRFIIDPGKSPHAPHVHADEEVLIVESGHGEIICDGKTTKVGPGSVMYSTPNVAHGINNTGSEPLAFYFVKWVPRGARGAR
jgi:mannose-6-phosphate isomerase-like protein (cupin superfamily)